MFNNPIPNGFLPFLNIWDEKFQDQQCGFFHPTNWNMEGYYDDQGNSNFNEAKESELENRKNLIASGMTSADLARKLQEKPLTPAEAFSSSNSNIFPVTELQRQLDKVVANKLQEKKGTPVNLVYEEGSIVAKPILKGANPITSYHDIPEDISGEIMIYEYPINNPPRGLYKIGYDPVRQDKGSSLCSYIVYKGVHRHTQYHNIIVAEYIGRKESPDENDKIGLLLADFYNTQVMYENEVPSVKNYYRRLKRLDALALQPDNVISKNIKHSKTSRVYGCHMTPQLKQAGERYILEWLNTVVDYDENNNPITTIDRIYSKRLLEELISYNNRGNFDLISALIMAMFQVQEERLDFEYGEKLENKSAKQLLELMDSMYKNSSDFYL